MRGGAKCVQISATQFVKNSDIMAVAIYLTRTQKQKQKHLNEGEKIIFFFSFDVQFGVRVINFYFLSSASFSFEYSPRFVR
jgi:hypothetical protein